MPTKEFTLEAFLIMIGFLTAIYFLGVFLHKRGLKNDQRKLDKETKTEINRLLSLDEMEQKIS